MFCNILLHIFGKLIIGPSVAFWLPSCSFRFRKDHICPDSIPDPSSILAKTWIIYHVKVAWQLCNCEHSESSQWYSLCLRQKIMFLDGEDESKIVTEKLGSVVVIIQLLALHLWLPGNFGKPPKFLTFFFEAVCYQCR